jgi:hypothetical protein
MDEPLAPDAAKRLIRHMEKRAMKPSHKWRIR